MQHPFSSFSLRHLCWANLNYGVLGILLQWVHLGPEAILDWGRLGDCDVTVSCYLFCVVAYLRAGAIYLYGPSQKLVLCLLSKGPPYVTEESYIRMNLLDPQNNSVYSRLGISPILQRMKTRWTALFKTNNMKKQQN